MLLDIGHGQFLARGGIGPCTCLELIVALYFVVLDVHLTRDFTIGLVFRETLVEEVVGIGVFGVDFQCTTYNEDGRGVLGVGVVHVARCTEVVIPCLLRFEHEFEGYLAVQFAAEVAEFFLCRHGQGVAGEY